MQINKFIKPFKDLSEDYDFKNQELIAKGLYGVIFKVRSKINNEFYAIKFITFPTFDE